MEATIFEAKGITKSYGKKSLLKKVNLTLLAGHIYGFIGENGAGKTTFLRIMMGKIAQDSGDLAFFGSKSNADLSEARRRVGSTIETPALYLNYTAKKNLELQRILVGNPDKTIVDNVLKQVKLSDHQTEKVKDYSLGMKQRLGIALTLVGNPSLLVLDEPVNGLDPKGIADLRDILNDLRTKQNLTILLSSHLLSELYVLATDFIFLHQGRILERLSQKELEQRCSKYLELELSPLPLGLTVIEKQLHTTNYRVKENKRVELYDYLDEIGRVADVLKENGILVTHLTLAETSLEDYYLALTGGNLDDKFTESD